MATLRLDAMGGHRWVATRPQQLPIAPIRDRSGQAPSPPRYCRHSQGHHGGSRRTALLGDGALCRCPSEALGGHWPRGRHRPRHLRWGGNQSRPTRCGRALRPPGPGQTHAAQRHLASKRKGSQGRERAVERVAAAHRKVRNQRKDLAHKLSRELVNSYDLIVHEDLKITNLVRRPRPRKGDDGTYEPNGAAAKTGLNRSIFDAGVGTATSIHRVQGGRSRSRSDRRATPATLLSGATPAGTSLERTGSPRPRSDVRRVGTRPTLMSTRP